MNEKAKPNKKLVLTLVIIAIAAVLVLIIFAAGTAVVPSGNTGVLIRLGAVQDNILTEGFHFKVPFIDSVINMNNQTVKVEIDTSAASKDLQTVKSVIAVNYHVDKAASPSLYKNVGLNYETVIVVPAVQESIKSVTALYTAEELITKRQEVGDRVKEILYDKLVGFGLIVDVFNIIDFNFSEDFQRAIEAKQTAQQQALKAEQDLTRIEVEAQQTVTQAKAEADSIKLIQETLQMSPDYIEYIKWTTWNGQLPNVIGSDGMSIIADSRPSASAPSPAASPSPAPADQ